MIHDASSVPAKFLSLSVDKIDPNPWQPRREFDAQALQDLASSLKQDGVLQPLVVAKSPLESDRYFVIAGERRLRAARLAGLNKVPVHLRTLDMEAHDHLRVALIENIQRSDLNIIEEAKGYRCLIDQFGYSQEECARKVGKDRTTITNALRILSLPESIHDDLARGRLSSAHARALAGLSDKTKILEARNLILARGLSVRDTENLCKRMKVEDASKRPSRFNADLNYISNTLQSILCAQVAIKGDLKKGRIELSYSSPEEFQAILTLLGFDSAAN